MPEVFPSPTLRPGPETILSAVVSTRPMRCRLFHLPTAGLVLICSLIAVVCAAGAEEPAWTTEQIHFFENRIRPVLVERCYRCHSQAASEKGQLKGGLYVDSRAGLLAGGDSGPALDPENPSSGLLLESLRYESFEMPPDGRLPDAVIDDFATWLQMGAPDPRTDVVTPTTNAIDLEAGREHWAYRPIPLPPMVPNAATDSATAIDRFVNLRLREAALDPLPVADRVTLARRLSFDLLGLPPTPEQIDEFLEDPSPDAYERYVDRLLESPQFGVRWGRHWLDIARFAESVTLRGLVQQQAWRYRDYVIEAFNRDLPYDVFLREQVAGDLLPAESLEVRQRQQIATGFLTFTDANLEDQDKEKLRMDVADEQISVIGEALLAQTIGCARCHDHKFDPIPTTDYYALAGILRNTRSMQHANVSRWIDRPLASPPELENQWLAREEHRKKLQAEIQQLQAAERPARRSLVTSGALPGIVLDDEQAEFVGQWKQSTSIRPYIDAGYRHDENTGRGEKLARFQKLLPEGGRYEVRLSYTTGNNRSSFVRVTVRSAEGDTVCTIDQRQPPAIEGLFVSLGEHVFSADEAAEVVISNRDATGVVIVDAVQFLPASAGASVRDVESNAEVASDIDAAEQTRARKQQRLQKLQAELKRTEAIADPRPLYQGVEEEDDISDMRVNIRGNVHNLGPLAPRGFLQVVSTGAEVPFPADESGRRQLGDWLANPENPLPARVYANRIWHWLFGAGIVPTTDNFGTTGQPPSHPELLDYLAGRLITLGWSTKGLVREIVLSETYRRRSDRSAQHLRVDPENRLLWRMNPKRLEAECLLDAALAISGRLDLSLGGSTLPEKLSADYGYTHDSDRRAIYWPQLRNARPNLLLQFDGANPSLVTGRRNTSSVAPQALLLLNDPWVLEQSRHTAARLLGSEGLSDSIRLQQAFRLCLGRLPSDVEEQAALRFLAGAEDRPADERTLRWSQLIHALFCSLDFRFLQ